MLNNRDFSQYYFKGFSCLFENHKGFLHLSVKHLIRLEQVQKVLKRSKCSSIELLFLDIDLISQRKRFCLFAPNGKKLLPEAQELVLCDSFNHIEYTI